MALLAGRDLRQQNRSLSGRGEAGTAKLGAGEALVGDIRSWLTGRSLHWAFGAWLAGCGLRSGEYKQSWWTERHLFRVDVVSDRETEAKVNLWQQWLGSG